MSFAQAHLKPAADSIEFEAKVLFLLNTLASWDEAHGMISIEQISLMLGMLSQLSFMPPDCSVLLNHEVIHNDLDLSWGVFVFIECVGMKLKSGQNRLPELGNTLMTIGPHLPGSTRSLD